MIFWFIISVMLLICILLSVWSFSKNRWIVLSLAIIIPVMSLMFYFTSQRYTKWQQHLLVQKNVAAAKSDIQQFGKPQTLIHQLEEKVKTSPNDPKAWYFLGKLYLGTGQNLKALEALIQARKLAPKDANIGFLYIEISFSIHQQLTLEQENFLKILVKKQPQHLQALNLLALNAYHKKDYKQAIEYWQSILSLLPDGTEEKKIIQEMILKTENKI